MKKNNVIISVLTICLFLGGCGKNSNTDNNKNETEVSTIEITTQYVEESTEGISWKDSYEYVDYGIDLFDDYERWSYDVYNSGSITSQGVDGINEDYYHTLQDMEAYNSGKIVIGDSRCCQMGIFEQVYDINEYAVFAVWGGHYVEGRGFNILADTNLMDIENCIISQFENTGSCIIYLFSSVNDYDYTNQKNETNYDAFVAAANKLKEFKVEIDGVEYSPEIRIIGFAGCNEEGDLYGTPSDEYNRYIEEYSNTVKDMLKNEGFNDYTTVMDILGDNLGFTLDRLHYNEKTIYELTDYICERD